MAGVTVRPGVAADLDAVKRIQQSSPAAAQWDPADYLAHDFVVALCDGQVAGFVCARRVAADESEILNLAVDPAWRRQGVAHRLLDRIKDQSHGTVFLEVRESNTAARSFYRSVGFQELTLRPQYYDNPVEGAVVMKLA